MAGVLDGVLKEREYLGDRFSYADLVFVPWFEVVPWVAGDIIDLDEELPSLRAWLSRLKARPAVVAGLGVRSEASKKL